MVHEVIQVEALTALISTLNSSVDRLVKKVEELERKKDEDVVYNLADLARILKVTPRTLYTWRANGFLPMNEIGGTPYITKVRFLSIIDGNPKMQKGGVQ